jgi:multicomponent Na+:H+ antiporter subunit B
MIKKLFVFIILGLFAWMLFPLTGTEAFPELSRTADKYVQDAPRELGAANLVTAVIVTYRGLDTLGEVAVLFIAAAGVGFLLRGREKQQASQRRQASQILRSGSIFLFPLILLFGSYVFLHGHLTPGGGFQGGVLIASALVLLLLSGVSEKINSGSLHLLESLSGTTYVLLGLLGLLLAGGFLDSRFMPAGEIGRLVSAGAIPLIYTLIGLKVGAELTGIIDNLQRDKL